jgi:hypothetical protein
VVVVVTGMGVSLEVKLSIKLAALYTVGRPMGIVHV